MVEFIQHDERYLSLRYLGYHVQLCSLHCTVGSVVYIYLVLDEVSFIVQLGVIDCGLGLESYGHGNAWICIQVYREM